LDSAHRGGLAHLAVKPSNILRAQDGQPMLLDFHLARPPLPPGGLLSSGLGGTVAYMPPEQLAAMEAAGERRLIELPVDGRADLFALGATLYHALGGRLPYRPGSSPP